MSNFPQKRSVNVAAAAKRKHDLSHYHVGTTDWGIMKPVECRYMVPGDEFNYNIFNETRVLNAMPSPTIGRFDVVMRAFFVPIHNVWSAFYDFLKNQPHLYQGSSFSVNSAPFTTLGIFMNGFVADTDFCVSSTSAAGVDFSILDVSSTPTVTRSYRFTRQGRQIINFLTSLGINIPLGVVKNTDNYSQKLYIILPLVCFWKFYFDWVVPSRFIPEHSDYIQKFISSVLSDSIYTNTPIPYSYIKQYLLKVPFSYFEDDVFTTSTEFPFQSSEAYSSSISILNPSSDSDHVDVPSEPSENPNGAFTTGEFNSFNMYTLQTLGKLQDLLNRNLIAGSKVQDWLLTEFGIRPNNDALHLSTYLGSKRTGLSVSDVLSNADTLSADGSTGVALGSYAGYVNNRNQFDFSYKAQEHGFYFITHEIVPRTSYYQGIAAQFDLGDRFDFFQPEFDNQQGAPIPFRRLYFSHTGLENMESADSQSARFDEKFGFQLQYADLKFAQDVVSGDFRTRFGNELKSWFLTRDMSYIADPNNQIDGIDEEFCLVKSEYQDWHYIFSDMNDELDPFLVSFYLQVPALRPMKSIAEGFEPTYKNGGKDVTLDFSGSIK